MHSCVCKKNQAVNVDEKKGEANRKERCQFCGTSVADYESTRLFGCPECYRYLFELVKDDVILMQGDEPHVGKNPQNLAKANVGSRAEQKTASAVAAARAKERGRT